MLLFHMLKTKKYAFMTALFSVAVLFLYPFLQVLPQGLNNFWFWFSILGPLDWVLYVIYGLSFGLAVSFFIYRWKSKTCPMPLKLGSGSSGGLGAFLGTLLPQCAACLSFASVFLPLSAVSFLATHSTETMILSVALIVLSLWMLGAFGRHGLINKNRQAN